MELVSIERDSTTISLFDAKGGKVDVYTSLTVEQNESLGLKFGADPKPEDRFKMVIETAILGIKDWNLGKDGQKLPIDEASLKKLTQRDFFAIIQVCTGKPLLDKDGNVLSKEDAEKKAVSA